MKSPAAAILILLAALPARAADWPTYRADAARSGYTAERLPDSLQARWTYRSPAPPAPAWPTSARLHFDRAQQPIVADGAVLFGTSADDRVVALELSTGRVRWTFVTEGPVRFAPAAWHDRVFVASDDGWLYALDLADGRLIWKRRGGPTTRACWATTGSSPAGPPAADRSCGTIPSTSPPASGPATASTSMR